MEQGLITSAFQLEDFFITKYKYCAVISIETQQTVKNIYKINFRPVSISKGFEASVKSINSIFLSSL